MSERPQIPQDEVEKLVAAHFDGRSLRCPLCSSKLEAKQTPSSDGAKASIAFTCSNRGCKAQGQRRPGARSDQPPWDQEQVAGIVAEFQRYRLARCPTDGTRLEVDPAGGWFSAGCPRCGRMAHRRV
jgi:hypothetical protein